MDRKVLYYPTILIPQLWLKWAILYWEKVSSIIPGNIDYNEIMPDEEHRKNYAIMNIAQDHGLFTPTRPIVGKKEFIEEVRDMIIKKTQNQEIYKNWNKRYYDHIHIDKLNDRVECIFRQHGLLETSDIGDHWFKVEKDTATLYMSLLAKHTAYHDDDYTIPLTNSQRSEAISFKENNISESNPCMCTYLTNIMPMPDENTSIYDIIRFRDQNLDELKRFSAVIEEFQTDISNASELQEIKKVNIKFRDDIHNGKKILEDKLADHRVKTISSVFRSLIAIKSPVLIATLSTLGFGLPPSVSAPIIFGTACIQLGIDLISAKRGMRNIYNDSLYSYLVHAEDRGII